MPRRRTEPKKPIDYNDPMRRGTRLQQSVAIEKREKFLASPEGKEWLRKATLEGTFGKRLQLQAMVANGLVSPDTPRDEVKSLSDISSELAEKEMEYRLRNKK